MRTLTSIIVILALFLPPRFPAGQTLSTSTTGLLEVHANFLSSIRSLSKNPENISIDTLKKTFPGDYKTLKCPDSDVTCAFVNESEDFSPVLLRTFQLHNPATTAFRSNLFFDITESPCLKKEFVDSYLGISAGKPNVQPPWTFVKEEEVIPYQMEYPNIKTRYTTIYVRIMLTRECVTELTMNFYPN